MSTYALVVGGNEADRYLESMLTNVLQTVDVVFYYDDQSTDGSADIVQSFPNVVYRRRDNAVPSFLEHEGRFRQASWLNFERYIGPKHGLDWVLCIDTDEVLAGPTECRPCELKHATDHASHGVILLPRPEVWGYDDQGWPLVRADGLWGNIKCTRLFRYEQAGIVRDVDMGCGSEPSYVARKPTADAGGLVLLHYGYAHVDDRVEKYQRYVHRTGHAASHIQSILATPTLISWFGILPPTMHRAT